MKLIDLPREPFGYDSRGRNVTRPAMTTALFLMVAIMIVLDIVRRRRRASGSPAAT